MSKTFIQAPAGLFVQVDGKPCLVLALAIDLSSVIPLCLIRGEIRPVDDYEKFILRGEV